MINRKLLWAVAALWAVVVLFVLTTPAHAQRCLTLTQVEVNVRAVPGSRVLILEKEAEVAGFMKSYNSEPPVTTHTADAVIVGLSPARKQSGVFFFEGGCFKARDLRTSYESILRIIKRMGGGSA